MDGNINGSAPNSTNGILLAEDAEIEHPGVDGYEFDSEDSDLAGLEAAYATSDEYQAGDVDLDEADLVGQSVADDGSEADLLRYAGYSPPPEELKELGVTAVPESKTEELDEDEEEEDSDLDPRQNKTKVGIVGSPLSKAAFVGGGGLLVVLAGGLLMGQFNGKKAEVAKVEEAPATSTAATAQDANSSQLGNYKSGMALTTQRNLLANAKPQQQSIPNQKARQMARQAVQPTPVPTAAALLPSPSMMMSSPLPTSDVSKLPPFPVEAVKPPTVEEAIAKWQALTNLGSYGSSRPQGSSSIPGSTSNGFSNETLGSNGMLLSPRAQAASTSFPPSALPVLPSVSTSRTGLQLSQLRANSSVPGMRDTALSSVLTGSSASGKISNSVIVAADNAQSIDPTSPLTSKYLMQLTDSIKDGNGAIAIPAGTQLVLAVKNFSAQSGLGELQVVAAIANGKEYQVPSGAMVVRSPAGAMLAFENRNKGSGFFENVIPSVFAGIAQAGQAINQPQSSTSVSNGGITTNVNSAKPNPLAAFAQGAGTNFSQKIQQQAQTAQQSAQSAPKTWELKAGSGVLVYVNSSFEI